MGFWFPDKEEQLLNDFVSFCILPLSIGFTKTDKKKKRIKLPDAIIAATTAIHHGLIFGYPCWRF